MLPAPALPDFGNLFAPYKNPCGVVDVGVKDVRPVLIRLDLTNPFGGSHRPRVVGTGTGQGDVIGLVQFSMDAAKRHIK